MGTSSWSSRVRHDSDATYQEWRDELITKLNAMTNLTADETNITPGAGARPGTSTEGGYAVYHLNDALHSTAPIYIRFGFGTNTGATAPRIQITVGTSTNGSGVLGGTALTTISSIVANNAATTDVARQSYLCAAEGFLGLDWKVGSAPAGGFFVCRTCDANGTPTNTGALVRLSGGPSSSPTRTACLRFAATANIWQTTSATATDHYVCIIPLASTIAATTTGSDVQAALVTTYTPRVQPIFGVVGVVSSELVPGGTFTATPVGTTPRTFLTCANIPSLGSGLITAMLWE